jgi:phosphate transport system permease protein
MTTNPATQLPEPEVRPADRPGVPHRTAPVRLLSDRLARWVVTAGGLGIIASILGILVFILIEVVPLTLPARVQLSGGIPTDPDLTVGAMAVDPFRTHVASLTGDGTLRVQRTGDGAVVLEESVFGTALPRMGTAEGELLLGSAGDGRLLVLPIRWKTSYEGDERRMAPEPPEVSEVVLDPSGVDATVFTAAANDDGGLIAAAQLEDGRIVVVRRTVEESFLTGERTTSEDRWEGPSSLRLTAIAVDRDARNLYGGTEDGQLAWWRLNDGVPGELQVVDAGGAEVTALTLLLGQRSLVVGQEDGSLGIWFPVRQEDGSFRIERIRAFEPYPGAIRFVRRSGRNKGFLVADETGKLGLHHSTSGRTLWTGKSPVAPVQALVFAPKADGAYVAGPGRIAALDIHNPHPEISLAALFGRIWYEGYPEPEYVWQSSGGTDDFEPKLSLVPLLVGTLKGTLYSLALSIPLAVLAAMYTSQFMHPRFRRIVKPTVEIMAALPSVVLGFLAGLWLAPRIEKVFPALLLMIPVLPALILAAGLAWRRLPRRVRNRWPDGAEVAVHCVVLVAGIWACLGLGGGVERLLFGGDFQAWLLASTGMTYDQRNAIVVGLAMGFAVIPIIFAIAEDAFSNVPRSLTSGSLALGANRWQTVTQVVLPTASPGIFSGIMVGFGRAIGETMIVLMATGNTPILDWSPFNGFRTLSANIAVEIPEAPVGGTLYRTLFLAALLLFVLTFLVNTAAEMVRQRLRRRYAEL